jgi:glyoxylase-like metal-dependent hydrolase (beta-lactamase superfamily II)
MLSLTKHSWFFKETLRQAQGDIGIREIALTHYHFDHTPPTSADGEQTPAPVDGPAKVIQQSNN